MGSRSALGKGVMSRKGVKIPAYAHKFTFVKRRGYEYDNLNMNEELYISETVTKVGSGRG